MAGQVEMRARFKSATVTGWIFRGRSKRRLTRSGKRFWWLALFDFFIKITCNSEHTLTSSLMHSITI